MSNKTPDNALRELRMIIVNEITGKCAQAISTGKIPANIDERVDGIMDLFAFYVAEKEKDAQQRTHNIYRKELDHLQRQVEMYMQRDQLKIEPKPLVVEVNPKSHTYLIGDQDEPNDNKQKG